VAESSDPSERKRLKEELARMTFGGWCRRFGGVRSPAEDLYKLKRWRESEPEVPARPWYKDFGSFKICGEG